MDVVHAFFGWDDFATQVRYAQTPRHGQQMSDMAFILSIRKCRPSMRPVSFYGHNLTTGTRSVLMAAQPR